MPRNCFVIMPFSGTESCTEEEWTAIFEDLIKPAVEGAGRDYECERSTATRGNIVGAILRELRDAYVVIADMTDRNANVFYELGVRHTLSDRSIIIAQHADDVPFDLRPYAYYVYDWRSEPGREQFAQRIQELLADVDEAPDRPDNPVSDFLGRQADVEVAEPKPPEPVSQAEVIDAETLVGPMSDGVDAASLARRLAAQGREPPLNSVGRLTRGAMRETVSPLVAELHERAAPERVTRDTINAATQPYLSAVAPSLQKLEQFALACVQEGWVPGVKMAMRLAGDLMTIETKGSGHRVRFAGGTAQFLAFRLLMWMGAKAMLDDRFESLRVILNEPFESRDSTGRSIYLSLPARRDLFWSEAFLGYADLTAMSLGNAWADNPHIHAFFGDEGEYRESLAKVLMVLSLFQPDENDQGLLYPGYQLISGARQAMQSLVDRLQASHDYLEQIAATFGEEIEIFEANWGDRARRANAQKPGSQYWLLDLAQFPENLTPPA